MGERARRNPTTRPLLDRPTPAHPNLALVYPSAREVTRTNTHGGPRRPRKWSGEERLSSPSPTRYAPHSLAAPPPTALRCNARQPVALHSTCLQRDESQMERRRL